MLEYKVRLYLNPWGETITKDELPRILKHVAETRAMHVGRQFDLGHYKRNSLGLAILDPTAPIWRPSTHTLLATIAIGPEGERFLPNAVAKAVEHRDKGQLAGYGAYVDLTQTADGDFTYGFSCRVDDTIGGASGQTEIQDACEAGHALVTFNYLVRQARGLWLASRQGHPRWFSDADQPAAKYVSMTQAGALTIVTSDSSQDKSDDEDIEPTRSSTDAYDIGQGTAGP